MKNNSDEGDKFLEYLEERQVRQVLLMGMSVALGRRIPQGNLTAYDIFQPDKSNEELEEDKLFEQRLASVEADLQANRLTLTEAAGILEMSLREFLEMLVIEREGLSNLLTEQEQQQIVDELVRQCDREERGRTLREFVEESVLDDRFLSALGIVDESKREAFIATVLAGLSQEYLGQVLREQSSVGMEPREFVEKFVLPDAVFSEVQILAEVRSQLIDGAINALCMCEEYVFNTQWFSALTQRDRSIPDSLVQELGEAVACRETERASVLLAAWDHRTVLMSPSQKNAALLLSYYAQWIDFDSGYLPRVEELLKRFRGQIRKSPLEMAHFNLSEGLVQFHHENYDDAIIYFNTAMTAADELRDDDLVVISRYYLARCFWKKGQYNTASEYADWAIQLSEGKNRQKRVAAIKMVKGWLCFLKGEFLNARKFLKQAQTELEGTDPINHGNVLSFYGRLDIKEGKYESAMRHFEKAIAAYLLSDRKHPHPNIARTHTNMAIACYDQARQLPATPESREQFFALRRSAIEHLDAAQHIYQQNPQTHNRGLGKVHYLRALLYASVGELDRAQTEVEIAYQLGEGKDDHVLMGRAKRIQYKITTDRLDRLALSEQTLVHAKQTDNRTLLARAYLNLASVLRLGARADEADKYIAEAEQCLMPAERNNRYWEEEITKAQEPVTDRH